VALDFIMIIMVISPEKIYKLDLVITGQRPGLVVTSLHLANRHV